MMHGPVTNGNSLTFYSLTGFRNLDASTVDFQRGICIGAIIPVGAIKVSPFTGYPTIRVDSIIGYVNRDRLCFFRENLRIFIGFLRERHSHA